MSKKRTVATDIKNPEKYFPKWLSCEKKNFHKKQNEFYENIQSLEENDEAQYGEATLAVNLYGEMFVEVEAENPEFAWMELFENEQLYEVVSQLSDKEKMILTLRFENKMTFSEISEELKISPVAAQVSCFRVFEKMRKFFI